MTYTMPSHVPHALQYASLDKLHVTKHCKMDIQSQKKSVLKKTIL